MQFLNASQPMLKYGREWYIELYYYPSVVERVTLSDLLASNTEIGFMCFCSKFCCSCHVLFVIQGTAVFDFSGTSPEVYGNLNTPRAVTLSAIIYCLRCMVGHDVPLNQVCFT